MSQYLKEYAETEAKCLAFPMQTYDRIVVIPSLGEELSMVLNSLNKASGDLRVLRIIVVNNRLDHAPELIAKNQELLSTLRPSEIGVGFFCGDGETLYIDRSSVPFPPKQGVGLARKIGCDVALALFEAGRLRTPWIYCTDADCEVSCDYFSKEPSSECAAAVVPFEHVLDWSVPLEAKALELYDRSLRIYRDGLLDAGSPYAYHSLGSTLVLRADAYAAVRGFPRRDAAEDFYLLNKLRKVGEIGEASSMVRIQQRTSNRVPFGTGVSTQKIAENLANGVEFEFYEPASFGCLAAVVHAIGEIAATGSLDPMRRLKRVPNGLFEAAQIALTTRTNPAQVRKHLHDWFDAFRTLKFIKSKKGA